MRSRAIVITKNLSELKQHSDFLPAVHKIAEGGYDGRGIQILSNPDDLDLGFEVPAVLEKKIDLKKEVAQMVAISQDGKTAFYPPVEMVFDKDLNMLDYQLCPANIPQQTLWKIEAIALSVVRNFNSAGLFTVELFVDSNDDVLVNETAPRVHNSGHHTIEAHYCSQFDMLWRIILGHPLGNTAAMLPSVMVNIIGEKNNTGQPCYNGINDVLAIDNAFVHLYGKLITKPGRKMGHVTILSTEKQDLIHKANKVKQSLTVTV